MDDYEFVAIIGKGSFATVYKAIDKKKTKYVAVKVSEVNADKNVIFGEYSILARLSCPNIVSVDGYLSDNSLNCIILEYANRGDLLTYINSNENIEPELKSIFRQICYGVKYLHDNKILHGDIKLENILMFAKSREEGKESKTELIIKLADFGFATEFDPNKRKIYKYGSPLYSAPEIVLGIDVIGPEIDIWSLGIVLYCMLYRVMPLKIGSGVVSPKAYLKMAVQGPKPRKHYSSDVEKLLSLILNVSVTFRLKIDEILHSEWLSPVKLQLSKLTTDSPVIPSPKELTSPLESPLPKIQP